MSEPVTAEDPRQVFSRAQGYFEQGDFANARKWFERRVEIGGPEEETFLAMYQVAQSMSQLGTPWPEVQGALLKAWEFRPSRAEPLYAIAFKYRAEQRHHLGYQFAKLAAEIPVPDQDEYASADIHWRATEEQAICASSIGKLAEAWTLWQQLLTRPNLPASEQQRIAGNRDALATAMREAAAAYPNELVSRLRTGEGDAEVVVSLVAGPDRESTELLLNSFLNCCVDVSRVGRFLVVDAGLSAEDRAMLAQRYGFLEFTDSVVPEEAPGSGAQLAQIRAQINGRFWLHLGQGWRFFAPESFITRLTTVLEAEPQVFQVGINRTDAVEVTGAARSTLDGGRYLLADVVASGPAMFDTARLDEAGGVQDTDADPIAALGQRAVAAGLRPASLDEVLCIAES